LNMGPTGPEMSVITTVRCVISQKSAGLKEIAVYRPFWDLQSAIFFKVGPIGSPEVSVKTTDMLHNIPEERRSRLQRVWNLRSLRNACCHSSYEQA
jgi:hypothetical protein